MLSLEVMRILVVGGSRGIGRQTVIQALEDGHMVIVFSRNPSVLDISHANLRLQAGNVVDNLSLKEAMSDCDTVICTLGLSAREAIGPPFSKASHVLSEGTKSILSAMNKAQVKRLICVTAIGTRDSAAQCSLMARLILRRGLRWQYKEKDLQESLIESSEGINWTIIRPTLLTNGRKKDAALNNNIRAGLFAHVSRADVAAIMLSLINQESAYSKALIVSYPPKFGDSLRCLAGYLGIN